MRDATSKSDCGVDRANVRGAGEGVHCPGFCDEDSDRGAVTDAIAGAALSSIFGAIKFILEIPKE